MSLPGLTQVDWTLQWPFFPYTNTSPEVGGGSVLYYVICTLYNRINMFQIYKQATIQFSLYYVKFSVIKNTIILVIVVTDVRHTDPCVEVVLQVIVTVFVLVRVLAHAVPLPLDPREVISHFLHVLQVPNSVHG